MPIIQSIAYGYGIAGLMAVICFIFFGEYNDVYGTWRGSPMRREALRIAISWIGVVFMLVLAGFLTKTSEQYSRLSIGTWFLLAPAFVIVLHSLRRLILGYLRSQGRNSRNVAIIGANPLGVRLLRAFREMPWLGFRFVGFFDDRAATDDPDRRLNELDGETVIGNFDQLRSDVISGKIDNVYITLPMRAEKRVKSLILDLQDSTASVYIIPDFFVFDLLHARWSTVQGLPIVSVYDTPFYLIDGVMKRIEDIVLSLLILAVIAIPMVGIAIGVKITSPGPVLFKQKRYGVNGEMIEVWKFRSMSVMENGDSICQATRNDPRVTPFGAFLRRTSLDELPQFFNVLGGSMSIVGPRPHAVAHNELYRKQIQGYMLRHKVKPGITGLAQINGFRGETETLEKMAERIRFDLDDLPPISLPRSF